MPTCGKTLTVLEKTLTVFGKALTVFRPTTAQADTSEAPLHPIPLFKEGSRIRKQIQFLFFEKAATL